MAAILSVTYTPNYIGCHRICFRTSEINYCCYLDESPVIIGTPKTISINLTEDYASCLVTIPVEFGCNGGTIVEGYVQACCVAENSEQDRIPFDIVFQQTECTPYSVQCNSSGVGEIAINDPGYGWPIGTTPTIEVFDSSGDGTGFTGYVTMSCLPGENFCSIDDIIITDSGENYFDINTLTVIVLIPPSCISNELILNGDFSDGLNDWTIGPQPDRWQLSGASARYNNTTYAGVSPGGTISQNILDPGKTYNININNVTLGCSGGFVELIVTAGTFDISGTNPNQYKITHPAGPILNTSISVTLTCTGTTEFGIYAFADGASSSPLDRISIDDVSVIEVCDAIEPELEVTSVEGCGTFTVPDCAGNPGETEYSLRGGSLSLNEVIICSGGPGPDGSKYLIEPSLTASCCSCKLYNVIVRNPIDVYYTSCNGQGIEIISVEAGAIGVTVCAIEGSVWPANPNDNAEILAINDVGICTENP